MSEEDLHHLLLYTYVPDVGERRGPHRPGHLAHIQAHKDTGKLVMAGALGTPPTGGAFVWRGATTDEIETFVAGDPYRQAELITSWRIEPWTLV